MDPAAPATTATRCLWGFSAQYQASAVWLAAPMYSVPFSTPRTIPSWPSGPWALPCAAASSRLPGRPTTISIHRSKVGWAAGMRASLVREPPGVRGLAAEALQPLVGGLVLNHRLHRAGLASARQLLLRAAGSAGKRPPRPQAGLALPALLVVPPPVLLRADGSEASLEGF